MSVQGHERPADRNNEWPFRGEQQTLDGGPPDDAFAPIPAIRGTTIEPPGSTQSCPLRPRQRIV
jgi:hypothetical protein